MASNTVCAANACIIGRIVTTWVPAWQALYMVSRELAMIWWLGLPVPSTEGQFQVRFGSTGLNLAACGRFAKSPTDALTARIVWNDFHCATCKTIAKHVTHIVPYLVDVKIIREHCLADIWLEETTLDRADFERDAARYGVGVECLAVGGVFGDNLLLSNTTTDRPQVDWFVALICHNCATDGVRTYCERKSSESKRIEKHNR
jgi:hypothetical protein